MYRIQIGFWLYFIQRNYLIFRRNVGLKLDLVNVAYMVRKLHKILLPLFFLSSSSPLLPLQSSG